MTLEALLADATDLTGLTMFRTGEGKWQCSSRWGKNTGWNVVVAGLPDVALRATLQRTATAKMLHEVTQKEVVNLDDLMG